jgi:hypothetical protein
MADTIDVRVTGDRGDFSGIVLENLAYGAGGIAAQIGSMLDVRVAGTRDGISASNEAYGINSATTQSIGIGGQVDVGGGESGVNLLNVASNTADAVQTFSAADSRLDGGTIAGDGDSGLRARNVANGGASMADQAVELSGMSVTSASTDAILLESSAIGAVAVADQTFAATDAAIDGLEGGVVMVNTGVAGITNASQKFNQEGGTINSGTGYFAVNATNNGVLAAQNVAVSGVAVNGDGVGLGVQLTSSGTDLTAVQGLNLNTGTLYSDDVGVVVNHTGGTQIASIANQTLMADGSYVVLANGASVDQKTIANTNVVNKPYRNQGTGYMLVDITEVPPGTSYDPNTP